MRCWGENEIKKTASVTQADGCRVGDLTSRGQSNDRAVHLNQVPFSAYLLNERVSQLRDIKKYQDRI